MRGLGAAVGEQSTVSGCGCGALGGWLCPRPPGWKQGSRGTGMTPLIHAARDPTAPSHTLSEV